MQGHDTHMSASFITVRIFLRFAGSTFLLFRVTASFPRPAAGEGERDDPSSLLPSSALDRLWLARDERASRDRGVGDADVVGPSLASCAADPAAGCASIADDGGDVAASPLSSSSMVASSARRTPRVTLMRDRQTDRQHTQICQVSTVGFFKFGIHQTQFSF
jgi:hypothetical protein